SFAFRHLLPKSASSLYMMNPNSERGESPSEFINQYSVGHKLTKDRKYDSGRFSGLLLSSSGSPRLGFSKSPSRLSSQDDLDDPDKKY
ncbi:unnamed protein product, partial [Brassica oleracea var. botrytis]